MSTGKFYQEAINEANDLVKMAEERARDKLIESVMPRIRSLLEKKILEGEGDDDVEDLLLSAEDDDDLDDEEEELGALEDMPDDEDEQSSFDELAQPESMLAAPPTPPSADSTLDIKIPKGVGKVSLSMSESKGKNVKNDTVKLDESTVQDLIKLVDGRGTLVERAKAIRLETKVLKRELDALSARGKRLRANGRIVEEFNAILRKSIGLKQEIKDAVPGPLAESAKLQLSQLEKEIKEMSTKTLLRSLLSEGRRGKMNEMYEDDMALEAADEPGEDMDMEDEAPEAEMSADDALAQIKSILDQVEMAGGDDLDMGEEEAEEEDEEEEEDQDEARVYEAEGDEKVEGASDDLDEADGDDLDEGEVYEIDESMLRRELARLRALREAANAATEKADHFGGGKAGKDAFENPPELNALGEAKKKAKKGAKGEEAEEDKKEEVKESRRNRALVAKIQEAAKAIKALDRQLAEQKLFNAKLLYVNKLMQSSSLTDKQFRSIVEALDSAKNLREAHLLYTSLNESLAKAGRSLSEGVRTAGASSRPVGKTSSSTTLNEGAVVDRWAILAGIK